MKKETIDPSILEEAKRCGDEIREGGVILYPAETLWGIGCKANDQKSIERIKKIKGRPDNKALITLVSSYRMLQNVVAEIPTMAEEIMDLSEEPVTIIYPKAQKAYEHLCSEDGRIGVRIVEKGFACLMMNRINLPLISTSANLSGVQSSGLYHDIEDEIIREMDCIADPYLSYELTGKASKVIMLDMDGRIKILR